MVQLDSTFQASQIGLVEPVSLKVNHVMLAHSLSSVQYNNNVVVQVMNTDTAPVTLYKGTKLASFTSQEYVFVLDEATLNWEGSLQTMQQCPALKVHTDNLSQEEAKQLEELLHSFQHLFMENTGCLGKTSIVTHSIKTTSLPIKQHMCCLPIALKHVVNTEVDKMLKDNII